MPGRGFVQIDVFTDVPLGGNPLAVILDAEGLDAPSMQAIAREMNLSETTFVLPATHEGAHYRTRIFTPRNELDFAGHPTVGTAHALAELGRLPTEGTVVQECGAGLVPLRLREGTVSFRSPPAAFRPAPDLDAPALGALLGCEASVVGSFGFVDVGIEWLVVELDSGAAVSSLEPDLSLMEGLQLEVTAFGRESGGDAHLRLRSFAPAGGINEDPVCGSGNACVAAILHRDHKLPSERRYTAVQGEECGRPGRVEVEVDDDGGVHVGGRSVTVMRGELLL